MTRAPVATDTAPKAVGPYSQAIVASGQRTIFCSGQIPLDPRTGELVGAEDVALQTEQVLQNLDAVLVAAGASLDAVVKTTVFLADLQDFAAMNAVYARHFGAHAPARATVEVAGLPKGALVEIEAIAVAD